jgi:hypothetical protein
VKTLRSIRALPSLVLAGTLPAQLVFASPRGSLPGKLTTAQSPAVGLACNSSDFSLGNHEN